MRRAQRNATSGQNTLTVGSGRNEATSRGTYYNPSARGRRNQSRATRFRTQQDTTCVTKLIDEWGNERFIRQQGRLSITKHTRVLSVLEKRALRYHRKVHNKHDADEILYEQALDETGMVATADLSASEPASLNQLTFEHR